ncbi:Biotin transport ATP-binding protein BioM [compost metagenome]
MQLAALASVLVTEPKILVMDEPTNQLDLKNRNLVEKTIHTLPEDVIVISHDLDLVAGLDRVLLVHEGRIAADGGPAEVIGEYRAMHGATA